MNIKSYDKYKESNVHWLSKLPIHWQTIKIKRLFKIYNGATPSSSVEIYWDGEIPWVTPEDLGKNSDKYITNTKRQITEEGYESCGTSLVPKKSIIFSCRAPIGHIAMTSTSMCTNQGCKSLTSIKSNVSPDFYYYVLVSAKSILQALGKGSTFAELSATSLGDLYVPICDLSEQNQIADFLDCETNRIDALIKQKQEFIRLLNEKRASLIYHAVTKGLNPKVKLKHSDISWLGEVPEHWEVKKLKYISKGVQTGITPPSDKEEYFEEEINWFTPGDFSNNLFLNDSKRKLSKLAFEDGVARFFPAYSVLLVGIGATLGKVGYIDKPASSNQQINAIFFDCIEKAKYYSYYLLINQPNVVSYANASTLAILNQTQTKDIPVIVPNFEELKQIVHYLDTETAKLDNLVSEVEKAIEKLYEYRTALITAAVTGKINVSNQ